MTRRSGGRSRYLKTRSKQGVLGGAAMKRRNLSSTHKIRTKDWTKAVESTYRSKAAVLKSTRKLSTFALGEEFNDLSGLSIELVFNGLGKDYTVISGAGFDTSFAVKLDIADDELFPNQALGFSMPLPFPPSHVTEIDISSNGWIGLYTKGTRFDDSSESVEEFLSENPRLAAYWENFNPTDADPLTGGLYFDADRTESDGSVFAMVTWNRVSAFGNWNEMTNSNTFQAKLRENGNIVLTWGDMTAERGLVGLSRGLVPPRIDVSELQFGATVSIPFFEQFSFPDDNDLGANSGGSPGRSVSLVLNQADNKYTLAAGSGFTEPQELLSESINFFPNMGLGFEMPLGFEQCPHTTTIDIDFHGWLGLVGGSFSRSDRFENSIKLLEEAPRLAVYWDSFQSTAQSVNGLFFDKGMTDDNDVEFAMVTWRNLPEAGTSMSENTFQAKLFANGTIVLTWAAMDVRDGLVGMSAGQTDISAVAELLM